MLNKFCCLAIAILCVAYSLSNALDPSLLLPLWVWSPVGGLFWVFNDLEVIEQQSCYSPLWVLKRMSTSRNQLCSFNRRDNENKKALISPTWMYMLIKIVGKLETE